MWLLLPFVILPIIEIALFIWVGGLIGVWATLLLVVASAVLGMAMLRSQGFAQLQRLQASFEGRGDPAAPLAHGAMILLSGILLIIPGSTGRCRSGRLQQMSQPLCRLQHSVSPEVGQK